MHHWRASSELFARSVPLKHRSPLQRQKLAQTILCFGSCIETPCNPKRSPLSEMTCPASSTAVFSLLPVPNRMPSNSALESASGPSDNSRSRGLSSGGSCLIVYLRPCTSVFYIIQVTAVRIQVSAASAVMRVSSNSALLRGARRDRQAGQRRVELGLPFFARSDVPPVSVAHQIAPVPGSRMQQHHRLARAQQQGDLQHDV
jgi:hypothetical protein